MKHDKECSFEIKEYIPSSEITPKTSRWRISKKDKIKEAVKENSLVLANADKESTLELPISGQSSLSPNLDNFSLTELTKPSQMLTDADLAMDNVLSEDSELYIPMLLTQPTPSLSLHLEEDGLCYLDYFEQEVARFMCIGPRDSNYFIKTFFTVASSEEPVAYALAAWGGVYFNGFSNEKVQSYKKKAYDLVKKRYLENTNLDSYGYYSAFCYFLIAIGAEISSGDVSQWYDLFQQCTDLLKRYGGLAKFCKDFFFSNDVKWLVSYFQHHDIMSSVALLNGTSCSMDKYNTLFKEYRLLETGNYGLDPVQGCAQPVFLILGEIMNAKVQFKMARDNLADEIQAVISRNSSSFDKRDVLRRQLNLHEEIDRRTTELVKQLNEVAPSKSQISILAESPEEDLESHLTLFELYRQVSHIYLALYIKRVQPCSSEIQLLLMKSLDAIDELIDTRLVTSLHMSLLICGVTCGNDLNRDRIRQFLDRVYERHKSGNLIRVREIIEEAWIRNKKGDFCVDWVEICKDFGWKVSIC
ncbi:Piso0_001472 [Millerozyma farinosa CBS 7064]|uniref:Piso0_001472 protein n=1 Tax=Pichia sorbitophila (strain ATCC MYA-4447 / BCRC 22081 / CBS 7064 / NBRC 10061 / NRRL Y-12695) TaxID=559304 RepID=G8YKW1_PICSO|nr:Piso0_001472 [Millerozyma farinosa CBS 7064]